MLFVPLGTYVIVLSHVIPLSLINIGVALFVVVTTYLLPSYTISLTPIGVFANCFTVQLIPSSLVLITEVVDVSDPATKSNPSHTTAFILIPVG